MQPDCKKLASDAQQLKMGKRRVKIRSNIRGGGKGGEQEKEPFCQAQAAW